MKGIAQVIKFDSHSSMTDLLNNLKQLIKNECLLGKLQLLEDVWAYLELFGESEEVGVNVKGKWNGKLKDYWNETQLLERLVEVDSELNEIEWVHDMLSQ